MLEEAGMPPGEPLEAKGLAGQAADRARMARPARSSDLQMEFMKNLPGVESLAQSLPRWNQTKAKDEKSPARAGQPPLRPCIRRIRTRQFHNLRRTQTERAQGDSTLRSADLKFDALSG